ncbi:tyrosine protein kinase, putative [Ixodes scapularis]|uniref:Tyrosine protein kinase, putative n=1 Tax=Ixodes scapularis TaxID=6945 RepID=B7P4T8_IXOSC|nr:tyrosine protein kinase, putative [Ixodes scapularis]|eukprot:XP_002406439.1 tyrosine protein kinase, putative [Ixodes scapularis]
MLTADHTVCILFYTPREPLLVPGKDGAHTAEHLCMQAAELCGIGPVTAQLFGLFSAETGIWFAPSANVKAKDKSLNLYFRLRYKPPTLDRIKAEEATLNYVYHQMRQDFVCGRVPELHHNRVQHRTLGLVVTDVVRHLIEVGQSPQQGSFSFSDFMPAVLVGPLKMRVLKPRLTNALNECWHNSRQNVNRVKEIYVNEFRSIVPEYGCEQFVAQVDSDGRVWEVVLQVNPHHPQMPGLRMHSKASKESITWTHICSISDLCFVNMNLSNCTVEISRRNGIPQVRVWGSPRANKDRLSGVFDSSWRNREIFLIEARHSVVLWTVQYLLWSPLYLAQHGLIVVVLFAYQKLQEKSDHESGWYLLRQSSSAYREFRLDFLGQDETPETLRIVQSAEDGTFRLDQGEGQAFPSLAKLVNDGVKPMLSLELGYCVPPSEYDKTQLLLCRAPGSVAENVAPAREPRECIHSRSLAFSENRKDELHGRFTVVRRAFLCKAKNQHREVAVKSLKPHLEDSHLKASAEFMAQCDRMLFWQCEAMVSSVGMVHSGSFGLVTEFLPLGSLDLYLRLHRLQLQAVDLVEAAKGLARALWYLVRGAGYPPVHLSGSEVPDLAAVFGGSATTEALRDEGLQLFGGITPNIVFLYIGKKFFSDRLVKNIFGGQFGVSPVCMFAHLHIFIQALKKYREGERLRIPADLHEGIRTLLAECWSVDPDNRPQPQTIMRDINQIFYEVYNSRRSHSYASVYPQAPLGVARNARPPSGPASPFPSPTAAAADSNRRSENVGVASAGVSPSPGSGDALSLRRGFNPENAICFGNTSPMTEVSASPWVIDSQQLVKGKPLGQGFFGEVYAASLKKWAGLQEEVVAVKCMRKSSLLELFQSESGLRDLQREIEIMKNLRHPNIVEIKGLVEEPEMMLVMEFLEMGSLLTYLQTYQTKVSHPQLVKYSEDIANGMEYLEEKHIVHRDLAARNILVASKDLVKISDFGLAQFTVGHYYYIHTQNRKLPMKWYAPESILYGKFSTKSDVWSYGVTLWEMFSYGEDPVIQDVTQENLGAELLDGKRLPCPPGCPTDIYRLMQLCWTTDSHQRPGFAQVKNFVRDL